MRSISGISGKTAAKTGINIRAGTLKYITPFFINAPLPLPQNDISNVTAAYIRRREMRNETYALDFLPNAAQAVIKNPAADAALDNMPSGAAIKIADAHSAPAAADAARRAVPML